MDSGDPRLLLCAVTDDLRDGVDGLVSRAVAAERGGVTMILLRLKHADANALLEAAHRLVLALRIPVVVSERLDVALAAGAAGVHLTATSMPVIAVRTQAPADFLIGASVSADTDVMSLATADYVTIGPVYGTDGASLGLEELSHHVRACGRPSVAIGGIDPDNAAAMIRAGAVGVAVIGGIFGIDDPEIASRELRRALDLAADR